MTKEQRLKARLVLLDLASVRICYIAKNGTQVELEYAPQGEDRLTEILAGCIRGSEPNKGKRLV